MRMLVVLVGMGFHIVTVLAIMIVALRRFLLAHLPVHASVGMSIARLNPLAVFLR